MSTRPSDALRSARGWLLSHLRRGGAEMASALVNHTMMFRLIGLLNARTGFLASVFLVYPASASYGRAYAYDWRLRRNRWQPQPVGVLRQNGRWTLMVGVSTTDTDFLEPGARPNLQLLEARVERLRVLLRAEQKTFAGVLPGLMWKHGVLPEPPERETTARVVVDAVDEVLRGREMTVIVLGGRGFIGSRVVDLLQSRGTKVESVDLGEAWPDHLSDSPVLLLNVAKRGALQDYDGRLWQGMEILNEVYPEPHGHELDALTAQGIPVYHVVGVDAKAIPSFPRGYHGAIPCCAAWPSDRARVIVRQLNPGVEAAP